MKYLSILFILMLPLLSSANSIKYTPEYKQSSLEFGFSFAQLKSDQASLDGYGISMNYLYSLSTNWGIQFGGQQIMSVQDDGVSLLYTKLKLGSHYALWGQLYSQNYSLQNNEQTFLQSEQRIRQQVLIAAHLEQYILNLSESIQPGTGLGTTLSYLVKKSNFEIKPEIFYSILQVNSVSMNNSGITLNFQWSL